MPRATPPSMATIRSTFRRAGRSLSFHRSAPQHNNSSPPPDRHPPQAPLSPSRSFPNLTKLVQRRGPVPTSPDIFIDDDLTIRSLPLCDRSTSYSITSTVTTDTSTTKAQTLPSPSKPFLRRISGSQKLRRLSLGRRGRMGGRTASFGDAGSRVWSSSGSSFLSPRSHTDDALWSRMRPSRLDRMRKKRFSTYSCSSDFEVNESDTLVDIDTTMLFRLPDRAHVGNAEDVFGRRRGDFDNSTEALWDADRDHVLACDVQDVDEPDALIDHQLTHYARGERSAPNLQRSRLDQNAEEDETIRSISKAIDSSKGRLRKSANMSRAFKAVIRSGEGWVRKSDVIQATMDSEDSKDPSMIILLDPSSCDPSNPHVEGVSTISEESASADAVPNNAVSSTAVGFSTSMTAKQCAATLETLLREMACKVSRYPDTEYESREVVRLRVMRIPQGGRRMDRKIKIMVTVREEDHIRTSVSFKRLAGLYSSRDSHIPLCSDIRDRFQREWPAVVEALYIRIPNNNNISKRQTNM